MLWLDANGFASCSLDSTIVFWDSLDGVSRAIVKLDNEITTMCRKDDTIYAVSNYNSVNLINIPKIEVFRTVVFSDSNIISIFASEE